MTRRREQILAELGVTRWRLRQATGEAEPRSAGVEVEPPSLEREVEPPPLFAAANAQPAAAASAAIPLDERTQRLLAMDWPQLAEAVAGCTACPLHRTRTQAVFGVGDRRAEWLLVGEAPGAEEDARGEPFVGQAGKLLDNMLAALDLKRGEKVYIANVLKCRPPNNRNPEPLEVAQCGGHLRRQVQLIQPRVILALGRFAAQSLLNTETSIGALRGRVHQYQGIPVVVTYHPAYLLRSLTEKAKAWADLCLARRIWRSAVSKEGG